MKYYKALMFFIGMALAFSLAGCAGLGGQAKENAKRAITDYNNKQAIESLDNICNRIDVGVAKKEFEFGTGSEREKAWTTFCLEKGKADSVVK